MVLVVILVVFRSVLLKRVCFREKGRSRFERELTKVLEDKEYDGIMPDIRGRDVRLFRHLLNYVDNGDSFLIADLF